MVYLNYGKLRFFCLQRMAAYENVAREMKDQIQVCLNVARSLKEEIDKLKSICDSGEYRLSYPFSSRIDDAALGLGWIINKLMDAEREEITASESQLSVAQRN